MSLIKRLLASSKHPYIEGLDNPDYLETNLSGNSFSISVPCHSSETREVKIQTNINIYDTTAYADLTKTRTIEYRKEQLNYLTILQRSSNVYGVVWRDTYLCAVDCFVFVMDAAPFGDGVSCFAPEQFEAITLHDTYHAVGPGGVGNQHITPINWKIRTINAVKWIEYEAHPDQEKYKNSGNISGGKGLRKYLFTPLDDNKYLTVKFLSYGYSPKEYCFPFLRGVMDSITSTLDLTLTDSMLLRQQQVLELCDQKTYSATRDPEPWVYHKLDSDDNILKRGSPPPSIPLIKNLYHS
ncbi:hypothetical protein [Agarilytica rhodophyticola]|uniref:hypothetical protein n=1 Tax=Agarilytica rhodophyticola TaxID=1737490 RepID=UPI000B345F96|nr:hypothetical protein [Agarilytica rhodophyticola]